MPPKITILGASGNGKSTLGRELARRLSVAYVELDALHHGPNWTEATAAELRARVEPELEQEGWVVDGGYEGKLGDLVLERADTAVWLDLPLALILWRLLRRTTSRIGRGTLLWNGNRETWRNAFVGRESLFAWAVRRHFGLRRRMPSRLARHPQLRVAHLRSSAQVREWLERESRAGGPGQAGGTSGF